MAFVKLDCNILNSTLWFDREAREIFITALLMALPHELKAPAMQVQAESGEPTGWEVPAGWYGVVQAAGPGICARARVDEAAGMQALERLGQPEKRSRSLSFEGRRMVRVDDGFIILNFMKYRAKDKSAADRAALYRQRKVARVEWDESWAAVVAFYGAKCAYCEKAPWTEFDHVIPTSKGGQHHIGNVVPACKSCNSSKGARDRLPRRLHPFIADVTRDRHSSQVRPRDLSLADADADKFRD